MYPMQNNGQFSSVPQAHWVHQKQVCHWAYGKTTKRDAFLSTLKCLKKKAGAFPSLAQGKKIDSGIVA